MAGMFAWLVAGPALAQHGGGLGVAAPPGPPAEAAMFPDLAARQQALEAAGWMLRGQSTFVQQVHPAFRSPYRGENSLGAGDQGRNTLSIDILVGRRLWQGAEVILDPLISRGFGLSGTRGLAAFPNGEAFRSAARSRRSMSRAPSCGRPSPSPARREVPEHDPMRFAGALPRERITITAGKFPVLDIFDDNRYAHDPRTPIPELGLRLGRRLRLRRRRAGFTNGVALEWDDGGWGLRGGAFQVAKRINSLSLDPRPLRGLQLLAQADRFYDLAGRPGRAAAAARPVAHPGAALGCVWCEGDITATEVSPAAPPPSRPWRC